MDQFVFVVRRDRVDLFEALTTVFTGEPDVEVILDRRVQSRRLRATAPDRERRRADRRLRPRAALDLRSRGWTLVRVSIPE